MKAVYVRNQLKCQDMHDLYNVKLAYCRFALDFVNQLKRMLS